MDDTAKVERIYWFVAAVFREIDDLAATLVKLRAHNVLADGLLVLTERLGDIPGKLTRSGSGDVAIATVDGDGWHCTPNHKAALGSALRALVETSANGYGRSSPAADGKGQSRIYAQLHQDAGDGANILVASVASPGEQLSVARIFLRQKCERVLTHEIAVPAC